MRVHSSLLISLEASSLISSHISRCILSLSSHISRCIIIHLISLAVCEASLLISLAVCEASLLISLDSSLFISYISSCVWSISSHSSRFILNHLSLNLQLCVWVMVIWFHPCCYHQFPSPCRPLSLICPGLVNKSPALPPACLCDLISMLNSMFMLFTFDRQSTRMRVHGKN